jgi:hypothetical protein
MLQFHNPHVFYYRISRLRMNTYLACFIAIFGASVIVAVCAEIYQSLRKNSAETREQDSQIRSERPFPLPPAERPNIHHSNLLATDISDSRPGPSRNIRDPPARVMPGAGSSNPAPPSYNELFGP